MRSIVRAAFISGALLLAMTAAAEAKRVALVIGNGAYENFGQLVNPVRDATALADRLTALEFDIVRLHTDVDLVHMLEALKTFREDAANADLALVFYAGHGQQAAGENYLFPIDSDPQDVVDLPREAVNLDEVIQNYLQRAGVESSLVVLDACRDASLFEALQQRTRDMTLTRGFAPAQVRSSSMDYEIWYSTADGALAEDGAPGSNSPFTAALLEALDEPGLDSDTLFRAVVAGMGAAGFEQKPVTYGRFREPLVLNPAEPPPAPAPEAEPAEVAEGAPEPDPAEAAEQAASDPEAVEADASAPGAEEAEPAEAETADTASPAEPAQEEVPAEVAAADEPADGEISSLFGPPGAAEDTAPEEVPQAVDGLAESEPNTPIGRADPVGLDERILGTIGEARDHDMFVVDAESAGLLRVVVETLPPGVELVFRLYDPDLGVAQNWGTPVEADGGLSELVVPGPGPHVLEVADSGDDGVSFQDYVLALDWHPAEDPHEPNATYGSAAPISAGEPIAAAIFPRYDDDHFLLTVDYHGELTLTVEDVPAALDPVLRVYDVDGGVLMNWTGAGEAGRPVVAVADLPAPGDYVIALADSSDDAADPQPVRLTPDFVAAPDRFEPNGSLGHAAPIAPGSTYQATILPLRDHDFYRLDIEAPGELTVIAKSVPEALDLAIRIYDPDFGVLVNWVRPSAAGQDTLFIADLPAAGRYVLEVADGSDDSRSVQPYALDVAFVPSPDATEPNGTYGQATAIPADGRTPLTILPRRDHDFLAVQVPREGRLSVNALEVPAALNVAIRVYDIHGGVLQNWVTPSAAGQDTLFVAEPPEAGRYVIEVADGSDDARSVEAFVLETRFEPAAGVADGREDAPVGIGLDTPVEAAIIPRRDHDFYDLPLDRPVRLAVTIDSPPGLDIAFRVHDRTGRVLANWVRAGGPGQQVLGTVDVTEPGGIVIEVADGSDDASAVAPYRLAVTVAQ